MATSATTHPTRAHLARIVGALPLVTLADIARRMGACVALCAPIALMCCVFSVFAPVALVLAVALATLGGIAVGVWLTLQWVSCQDTTSPAISDEGGR